MTADVWSKCDDGAWHNDKLLRAGRSARGLFWDAVSLCGDKRSDGYLDPVNLPLLGTSPADPDLKALVREGLLHRRGDECKCIDRRGFEWSRGRGYLIHDWLDYNPSAEENDVARAQLAERRDPELRQAVRARDFGRCRYCAIKVGLANDHRSTVAEQLDHVDPRIADGAANLVLACKSCNSRKKKRTPEQAQMTLLTVDEVRAKHYAELGVLDPETSHEPDSNPEASREPNSDPRVIRGSTRDADADSPGRVGYGSGQVGSGSGRVGPPSTHRSSSTPNPYLRSGHGDPALEPPPPDLEGDQPRTHPPPRQPAPRSQRRRKRKGNR